MNREKRSSTPKKTLANRHLIRPQYVRAQRNASWWELFTQMNIGSQLSLIFSALLILAGAIGLFFVQGAILNQSQDIRQQASVDNGQVLVRYALNNNQEIIRPGKNTIDFFVDTQSLPTRGISLVMEIWPGTVDAPTDIKAITEAPDFQVAPESGLQGITQEVEQKGDGYLILAELVPTEPQVSFASSGSVKFASLTFTYTDESAESLEINDLPPVSIVFDNERSVARRYLAGQTSEQAEDILRSLAMGTFESPTRNNQAITQRNQQTLFAQTQTSEASASAESNQKGQTQAIAACNETCSNNHQCAAGFACYANRCRNPLNLESVTCAAPDSTTANSMAQQCNQACTSHRDCPANMLCHAQSSTCRLATNPGSLSCSPATNQTISGTYETKGGLTGDSNGTNASGSGALSDESPIIDPTGVGSEFYGEDQATASNQISDSSNTTGSFLEQYFPTISILGYEIATNLVLAGMVGLGILLLILLMLFLSLNNRKKKTIPMNPVSPVDTTQRDAAAQQIQQKIASLQNAQTSTPPISTTPIVPAMPPMQQIKPVQPVQPAQPTPPVQPVQPVQQMQPTNTPKPVPASSSMLSRMRLKGITKPGSSSESQSSTNVANQEKPSSQGASQDSDNS